MTKMDAFLLNAEPIEIKRRRRAQEQCQHQQVFAATAEGPAGKFTTMVCVGCGKTWRAANVNP